VDTAASLSTIAAAGLGLAGFSGVMTAFMQRPGRFTALETYRVGVLLGVSFGATLLAMLPMVLSEFAMAESRLWAVASLAMLVYSCGALAAFVVMTRRFRQQAPELFNRYLLWGVVAGHVANIVLQALNAAGATRGTASGIYLSGLVWYLVHAGLQFSRILLIHPR
jgi:hypothetical protein